MNTTRLFGPLVKTLTRRTLYRKQLLIEAFSSSFSQTPNPKLPNPDREEQPASEVYQRALRTQRPPVIEWNPLLLNSVSLIGTVEIPVRMRNTKTNESFGQAYTWISPRNRENSTTHSFRILAEMQGEIAMMGMTHVKPGDLIYVSGHLGSYTKADEDGKDRIYYKIIVNVICHVEQSHQGETKGGENCMGMNKNYLELWKMFFASPQDWWDNRKNKRHINSPDFKHKDTGAALWISPDDPPWVKHQLQLFDPKQVEERHVIDQDEYGKDWDENKLYRWQLFFRNPHEWWDRRKKKKSPLGPDFVHKHTGEVLWLVSEDPPWVKKQLELLDSKTATQTQEGFASSRSCSHLSQWVYDDSQLV